MFADEVVVKVKGGRGGDGSVHFSRRKYEPFGGPDGGDGGRGGSVILKGTLDIESLISFKPRTELAGASGAPGGGNQRSGRAGADLIVRVPVGTSAYDDAHGMLVGEVVEDGGSVVLAHGGKGGRGNMRFATPRMRVPRSAEPGGAGEERTVRLVYRAQADVALVDGSDAGSFAFLAALIGKPIDNPHLYFQAPRIVQPEVEFKRFSVVVLPYSYRGDEVSFHFERHIARASKLIVSTVCLDAGRALTVVRLAAQRFADAESPNLESLVVVHDLDETGSVALAAAVGRLSAATHVLETRIIAWNADEPDMTVRRTLGLEWGARL